MKVAIYGSSDDLITVEVDGEPVEEVCTNAADGHFGAVLVGTEERGVLLSARYADDPLGGSWSVGLAYSDGGSDAGMPDGWSATIEPEHGYSPRIVLACPNGTPWSVYHCHGQRIVDRCAKSEAQP